MIYNNLFRKNEKSLISFRLTFLIAIAIFIIWVLFNPHTLLHSIIAISLILILYILQDYIENKALLKFINEKQADYEELISVICDSSKDLIAYKDFNGNYLYCNSAYLKNINKTFDEIKGEKTHKISKEDNEIINECKCISKEKQITLKNNNKRWFKITKSPIINHENRVVGIFSVARDIDAEKTAAEQRETYVATITHDLKTPTIAQIKALDLLLNNHMGPLNHEQKELLMLTKDSCNYMYEMLSTILSTYKYENGDYTLNLKKCNIISLAEESINNLEAILREKNTTIYINKEGNFFDTKCDRIQIKRVITNILENAISYACNNTPIIVTVKQDKNGIRFEAKNKSTYINPEAINSLFKKHVSQTKFNKIGIGLGLYLSKQIINAHNGKIYAKSFEDNHNIFGFILPLKNNESRNNSTSSLQL